MISVVVPAYNEEKNIGACLDALVCQNTRHPFEVVVVDNFSTDSTYTVVNRYKKKLRLHIVREKIKGRGPARRAGFAKAAGNIILSTDADTVVPFDWVEQLVNILQSGDVGAVSGTGGSTDGNWLTNILIDTYQPISMHCYRIIFGHYWLSGFNFAIYKSVYEKSGGFDVNLNALEDIDLAMKVSKVSTIGFFKKPAVVFSSRRFKKSFWLGFWSYFKAVIEYTVLQKRVVAMSDVR